MPSEPDLDAVAATSPLAQSELAELRKNDARYQWLRDEHDNGRDHFVSRVGDPGWRVQELDAAIDAAIEQERKHDQ